jgi:inhibitor of cysteine peptidase
VTVAAGESFTITLCSNPTTGFQWWETAQISNPGILEQTWHQFTEPETQGEQPPVPDTAGAEVWSFQALKKDSSTLILE